MSHLLTAVYAEAALADYHFGESHPFGPHRYAAFMQALEKTGLRQRVVLEHTRSATLEELERFHTPEYVVDVRERSKLGEGYLDAGDTPARRGIYEAAARVVGTVLNAVHDLCDNRYQHAFVPIAGLHHARRDAAQGFCVFNDIGVAIETLRQCYQIERIAYVDIDAHHGDGVYYSYASDPNLAIVDLHEDGRFLYPGTGARDEVGTGEGTGTKLNLPLPMGAGDREVLVAWQTGEALLRDFRPEFILLQAGADSLAGDPITHLSLTADAHAQITTRLCELAAEFSQGRLLGLGGGGYRLDNLAVAWTAVVRAMLPD